jgi:hypothetical protein
MYRYILATKARTRASFCTLTSPRPLKFLLADCDFVGNWAKGDAMNDPFTAKSQTGYSISYASCPPIIWASKLQTKVVLSTTKSEDVGLLESLHITVIMMNLLKEMQEQGVDIPKTKPVLVYHFEDNAGAIHMAKAPRIHPQTQ